MITICSSASTEVAPSTHSSGRYYTAVCSLRFLFREAEASLWVFWPSSSSPWLLFHSSEVPGRQPQDGWIHASFAHCQETSSALTRLQNLVSLKGHQALSYHLSLTLGSAPAPCSSLPHLNSFLAKQGGKRACPRSLPGVSSHLTVSPSKVPVPSRLSALF